MATSAPDAPTMALLEASAHKLAYVNTTGFSMLNQVVQLAQRVLEQEKVAPKSGTGNCDVCQKNVFMRYKEKTYCATCVYRASRRL